MLWTSGGDNVVAGVTGVDIFVFCRLRCIGKRFVFLACCLIRETDTP